MPCGWISLSKAYVCLEGHTFGKQEKDQYTDTKSNDQ